MSSFVRSQYHGVTNISVSYLTFYRLNEFLKGTLLEVTYKLNVSNILAASILLALTPESSVWFWITSDNFSSLNHESCTTLSRIITLWHALTWFVWKNFFTRLEPLNVKPSERRGFSDISTFSLNNIFRLIQRQEGARLVEEEHRVPRRHLFRVARHEHYRVTKNLFWGAE